MTHLLVLCIMPLCGSTLPTPVQEGRTMKRLLTLCLALSLGGCAGRNAPELPQPVNGRCGIMQDACLLGDPSGTGDITPPLRVDVSRTLRRRERHLFSADRSN